METPLPNGDNGERDSFGRFAKGNSGGPGNPYAKRAAALHAALMDSITPDDIRAIAQKLIERAKAGDIHSAKEVLTRVVGRPREGFVPSDPDPPSEAFSRENQERAAKIRDKILSIPPEIREKLLDLLSPSGL